LDKNGHKFSLKKYLESTIFFGEKWTVEKNSISFLDENNPPPA